MKELLIYNINNLDSRLKEEELKIGLYSTLIPFLLSFDFFKYNIDIQIFLENLKLKKEIKPYVYNSRTLIVAKIAREIEKFNKEELVYNIKFFKEYCKNYEKENNVNKYSKSNKNKEERIVQMLNKYSRNKL